jgi:hypothetical protein
MGHYYVDKMLARQPCEPFLCTTRPKDDAIIDWSLSRRPGFVWRLATTTSSPSLSQHLGALFFWHNLRPVCTGCTPEPNTSSTSPAKPYQVYCMHVPSLPLSRLCSLIIATPVSFSHLDLHVTGKIFPSPQPRRIRQVSSTNLPAHACSRFAFVARGLLHSRLLFSDWTWLDLEIDALTSVVGPERSTTRTARLSPLVHTDAVSEQHDKCIPLAFC